ncbi:MAG TPA: hypothetical protein DDX39_10340 [Bacteroidales bacterium]|nr:MAG: hypothetical protein A2W98_15585 [Bacteroidetes bacterium GWF2_33_38]HBF89028.1 hypothetical protein [Bacteroidales bacterium]
MVRIAIAFVFFLFFQYSFSQNYGNEWINYSQKYFKVKVSQDGIYRISRQALVDAAVPIESISLYNIQLFSKGEEQAIYIKSDTYGILEYIEFFGEKNNAWLDIDLYGSSVNQTNPYYSLINDTNVYFLTWNTSVNNKRYTSVNETNFSSYSPTEYCFKNSFQQYVSSYHDGGDTYSEYSPAEGWFDANFAMGTSITKSISTKNAYTSGVAEISLAAVSASNASSTTGYNHHIKIECLDYAFDTTFYGYRNIKKNFTVSSSDLTDNTSVIFSSVDNLGATTDYNAVSYIDIKYPHTFDFENETNFRFRIPENSNKTYIEISNFNASENVILYDISNSKRIKVVNESSLHKAIIPQSEIESDCYMIVEDSIKYISEIVAVNTNPTSFGLFDNYIVNYENTEYLIISNSLLWDEAVNYKIYRNSTGLTSNVVDINQLYDQFAYGIEKHPLSIRNFVSKAIASWENLEYIFLIGKSVQSSSHRAGGNSFTMNHIPSLGYPASDLLLIEGLNSENGIPISIGRLPAYTESEVEMYLNKVAEFESNEPAMWMKNVIHFGGGNDEFEQAAFENYLNNYKSIIEDTLFGGAVTTILKNSSDPIQLSQSDTVEILIDAGTSLITFFGHGYTYGFDQNIDDPDGFNNKSKYPLLLSNSCYTGNIHTNTKSISETWVITQDNGAIGFLASTSEGNSYYLDKFSEEFYRNISFKNYGKSIGFGMKSSISTIAENFASSPSLVSACLQFNLNGDPAIVLNSFPKPDLTVENSGVYFNPISVTTNDDNFQMNIIVSNLGKAIRDSFMVSITRKYPDATSESYSYVVDKCIGKDTLSVVLPVNPLKATGVNEFSIYVDGMQEIDELSELNNSYTVNLIITSDDITPIFPYDYSIYPDSIVTLKASIGDPFISDFNYIFEIDTTDLFTSPLSSQSFFAVGGVVEWNVPFELQDTTVYFWRVSKMPEDGEDYNWKESSFIYINNKTGWSQAHFFQFKENTYNFIDYNRTARSFDYITTPRELICRTIGSAYGTEEWRRTSYYINGVGDFTSCGTTPSIMVAVIDSLTLEPWESNRGDFGHRNYEKCPLRARLDKYFIFSSDSLYRERLINFINNYIPDGNYVVMYTFRFGYFQQWTPEQYSFFESLSNSAMQISNVPDDYPYILFFQKGNLESVEEMVGEHNHDDITLSHLFPRTYYYGDIKSVQFGPSSEWNTLRWRQTPSEENSFDESSLVLYGVNESGNEQELISDISETDTAVYNLQNNVDAQEYPFVKLLMKNRDDSAKTPAQLKKWQLISDLAPETAINFNKGFYFYNDTVNEGDSIIFSIATENISDFDMDSLLIKYLLQNHNSEFSVLKEVRERPHPAGDVLIDTLKFSTEGLSGLNSVWIEVNPINSQTGKYDQIEQYHFNNIAQKYFFINSDITNPLLDVVFDGVHIMNGEIVSAKPQIVVSLKDENKFLALNDTSVFKVYLKPQETGEEVRIYFQNDDGSENMKWIPAELPDNSCKIIYEPILSDGVYELRVQAKDVSNNESGQYDYNISFEVINQATITDVFNYPNPFSTKTRFVFTLTGSEIPDEFEIHIFTISGKLVKVISLDELGTIHIGNNITEYFWDGIDMFGDKLANGVYFYKVNTQINGETLDKRQTGAEKYFNNNIGKLYIMR